MAWVGTTLTQGDIQGRTVLEVGAYNVNGTVRPLVERLGPTSYVGIDQTAGPGVDLIVDAGELVEAFGPDAFDVVLSFEMLEHAQDWRACMIAMSKVLRPGGLLILTTRGPGFPRHEFPSDHWRFTVGLMNTILVALGLEREVVCSDTDPASPGVFARARKPAGWPWHPASGEMLARMAADPAPLR